jgi:hypothetical protein
MTYGRERERPTALVYGYYRLTKLVVKSIEERTGWDEAVPRRNKTSSAARHVRPMR